MKTLSTLALTATLALGLASTASAFDRDAVSKARVDLQAAVNPSDLGQLIAVRARFAAMAAAEPDEPRLHVWVAAATWRALALQMSKDKAAAERLGDDALDHLEKALAKNPKDAEALALKGGLQGMLISVKPNAMMTLGPQSGANLARALALESGNPRVHLLLGIGNLHKPVQFGGGPALALESFLKAEELFAKEAVTDPTAPDWGHDDAYLWEGRARMETGEYAAARTAFQHALEVNPDNGWVRTRLLPEAEKALAAKEK